MADSLDGQNVSLKFAGFWEECIDHVDRRKNVLRNFAVRLANRDFGFSVGERRVNQKLVGMMPIERDVVAAVEVLDCGDHEPLADVVRNRPVSVVSRNLYFWMANYINYWKLQPVHKKQAERQVFQFSK